MKKSILLIMATFSSIGIFAQEKSQPLPEFTIVSLDPGYDNAISFIMPQAKYQFENDKGRVYALPLDKMLCLVPKIGSNMPVQGKRIPSQVKVQRGIIGPITIVPRKKEKE